MGEFYYSKKKKIRGWKRHIRKIDRWKKEVMEFDLELVRTYQRDYAKLWIHPFYSLERTHPPAWYNRLLLEAMFDVYFNWHEQMSKESDDFYLKMWLFDPQFINSQIVAAYEELKDYYSQVFEQRARIKPFPLYKFNSLSEKIEMFDWELHIDSENYDSVDLLEDIKEGWRTEKQVNNIRKKAYKTEVMESNNRTHYIYHVDVGDIWIGSLKRDHR
ncbi:hypothetical protein FZW96_14090 [Bacillus sp. BGMRC 2118]|nr:hypothetical protein FZW96_14090 [Bacillus sp. BGMRC 2118]